MNLLQRAWTFLGDSLVSPMESLSKRYFEYYLLSHRLNFLLRLCEFCPTNPVYYFAGFFKEVEEFSENIGDIATLTECFSRKNGEDRYSEVIKNLKILQRHIAAVMGESNWNRTSRGEAITRGTVYLGGTDGLPMQPIWFWLEKHEDPKFRVVSQQAMEFIRDHAEPMIMAAQALLHEIETYKNKKLERNY
ncbi:MAG: hypothetical protein KGI50_03660 [Patescibacteria group bacterium]|nr:hypothetical protein [Patescibacteria group bacterium]MDE2438387.1 hypothetical protein [Patescibacteria group bacterium]